MTAITVFSAAASFLSFASIREASSVPKFEDFAWGTGVATVPPGKTGGLTHGNVFLNDQRGCTYDTISANYLILGVDSERFHAAYVAFPGRSNFDRVAERFLQRYGEPEKGSLAPDDRCWSGNDVNVRLQYQADTDEGILALTYQGK